VTLGELVAIAGSQVQVINILELADSFEAFRSKRALALESVQHDAFNQIAERDVMILSHGLHDFEYPLLDANAGLHTRNRVRGFFFILVHIYQCTKVLKLN